MLKIQHSYEKMLKVHHDYEKIDNYPEKSLNSTITTEKILKIAHNYEKLLIVDNN